MPRNNVTYPLSAALIEAAHDNGIGFTWPGIEPVASGTCRDLNLLLSAERQPYQYCFGEEMYPTLFAKAAYLFYHLTTSHIFYNGNKRTAVLCLDVFLSANSYFLTLSNDEVQHLAESVAASGEQGERFQTTFHRIRITLEANAVPLSAFRKRDETAYRVLHKNKWAIRRLKLNQVGFPLSQTGRPIPH